MAPPRRPGRSEQAAETIRISQTREEEHGEEGDNRQGTNIIQPRIGFTEAQRDALFDAQMARENALRAKIEAETREINSRTGNPTLHLPPPVPSSSTIYQLEGEAPIPPEAMSAINLRPDLPRDEIKRIYLNTFTPKNLYKLTEGSIINDNHREQNMVLEGESIKFVRTTGTYKDYGKDAQIWSEGFLNYLYIMQHFHGSKHNNLCGEMILFHSHVIRLSRVYDWSNAVVILALVHRQNICSTGPTDPGKWVIPQELVHRYCHDGTVKTMASKRRASEDVSSSSRKRRIDPNNDSIICRKYQSEQGCQNPDCHRCHEKKRA
ncbi:MAG: hypothetical protein MMC33_009941 [Icmadophila ericetorum]|nr:hypothetical protein [Icmadophila ericetorum]